MNYYEHACPYRATFRLRGHFIIVRPLQDRHLDNGGHGAMHKGSVGGVEKVHAEGDRICFLNVFIVF